MKFGRNLMVFVVFMFSVTLFAETVNESGSVGRGQWEHFGPFTATDGTFSVNMAGTNDADLYVRVGTAPTSSSYNCRPYKNGSNETCEIAITGEQQVYVSVNGYSYSAANFNLVINYESDATPPVPTSEVVVSESGTLAQGAWEHFGPFNASSGEFKAVMTGSGDADLYVKKGSQPTTSSYDCRPYTGGSNENCNFTLTSETEVYVSVYGYSSSSFDLEIAYQSAAVACTTETMLDDCGALNPGSEFGYWSCESELCSWNIEMDPETGAKKVETREEFEALSRRNDVPGAMGAREVKFLITDVDTENPVMHFINTTNHEYHYYFYRDALGHSTVSNRTFNSMTYFTDTNRKNLAGSIIAHDSYQPETGEAGIYTIQFWPTDPVKFDFVKIAWDLVLENMTFATEKIAYYTAGETQRELYESEITEYNGSGVKVVSTDDLFGNLTYSPLNLSEAYGVLKIIGSEFKGTVSVKDVVVFRSIPNDLTHVAGIVTDIPQTPLSHINLKAKQNNTPNAYIKDASTNPDFVALDGKYVHYKVTSDGYILEEATQQQVEDFLESVRPAEGQTPIRNLEVTTIAKLTDIGTHDSDAYGSKAANVAELAKFLPAGMVPDGNAVPFYFYDELMKHKPVDPETGEVKKSLYEKAVKMMAKEEFQNDPAVREDELKDFRKKIKKAEVPQWIMDALDVMHKSFPEGTNLRMRSSTNNEDLVGFNGAGLYKSSTHRLDEGHIVNTAVKVWAGLWTYRAFEERDFYRIDHFTAAMGILVHPNYDDELANGVAVTKNIYDPNWDGFYVNVQVGEDLVTNPDEESVPDEILISAIGENYEYETQYIRHSNKTVDGANVMSNEHLLELVDAMEKIQEHFKEVYDAENDENFAMDIEFKITKEGILNIKQARPWVD